jgi:hypothetical protein
MIPPRLRLILAAVLFAGWIGWLAYLAVTTTHPVVLSRPQFLVAGLDVIAELKADGDHPDPHIRRVHVLWPRDRKDQVPRELDLANLKELTSANGWQGPGAYLLPLVKMKGSDEYRVAVIPPSPGYSSDRSPPLRIYPDTTETRSQEQRIRSGKWEQ